MAGRILSTPLTRLLLKGALASLLGVTAGACGSTEEKLKVAKLSEPCTLDSHCEPGLKCIFERCHEECEADGDCDDPDHARCVKTDRGFNVCQLDEHNVCDIDDDCQAGQICAQDLECRNPCSKHDDCIADQVCASGACASVDAGRDELVGGNLVNKRLGGAGGAPGSGGSGNGGADGGDGTGGDDGSGGTSGSGGENDAGGATSSGGAEGSGGETTDGGSPGGTSGSGGSSTTGGSTGSGGGGPVLNCTGEGLARFHPSNLPAQFTVPADAVAHTHTQSTCVFQTDDVAGPPARGPHFPCPQLANLKASTVTMSDGSEAAVLPLASLTIPVGATLRLSGRRPVILAVQGDVIIHGTIVSQASDLSGWAAGGAPGRTAPFLAGLCPVETVLGGGRGSRSTDASGGGGGAYCGKGGESLPGTSDSVPGGVPYGSTSLVPLLGGSSGGSGSSPPTVGGKPNGGGALQIVSGSSILVSETGIINMGGRMSTEGSKGRGGGGGSGGAILLEAPLVTIRGIIAANGASGSGGYLASGSDGQASDQPAAPEGTGGPGAAGASIDGGNGTGDGGGGGGGAGRIRINTGCGGTLTISQSAVISPADGSGCFTTGDLGR